MIRFCTESGSVYEIENKTIRKAGEYRRVFTGIIPEKPEVGKCVRVFFHNGQQMLTSEVTSVSGDWQSPKL